MTVSCIVVTLDSMGKKKNSKLLKTVWRIAALLLLLVLLCAVVYFLFFPKITLVSDSSFRQVYSSSDIRSLRLEYASHGLRLKVLNLADSAFDSEDAFRAALSKAKGRAVLLSPLASEYCVVNEIRISELLEKSVVVGINMNPESVCFDVTLVPDEKSGWIEAAAILAAETSKMSQNVGLVYESETISYIEDIVLCFPEGHVSEFCKTSGTSLFPANTLEAMDGQGIVIAMCPYVSSFHRFFVNGTTVQWIVDYRFTSVVPSGNLYGVVVPDLSVVIGISKTAEKGMQSSDSLPYKYVKK